MRQPIKLSKHKVKILFENVIKHAHRCLPYYLKPNCNSLRFANGRGFVVCKIVEKAHLV